MDPIVKTTPCWRFLAAYALELAVGLWFNGNRIMIMLQPYGLIHLLLSPQMCSLVSYRIEFALKPQGGTDFEITLEE